eukprot:10964384-Alexandrium_andersonii.AAC.1
MDGLTRSGRPLMDHGKVIAALCAAVERLQAASNSCRRFRSMRRMAVLRRPGAPGRRSNTTSGP